MAEINSIESFIKTVLPELTAKGPDLFTLTISIVIYCVLIFIFYRFVAKRDVFGFDIKRFKREKESFFSSVFNKFLSLIKYGGIFPFFVFIWFAGFSVLLFMMTQSLSTGEILRVSVAFVAAIRVASYYNDDLSKDMAKLIPFALLGVALVEPNFLNSTDFIQLRLPEIPLFITEIATYFSFIVILEWALRILLSVKFFVFGVNKKEVVKEQIKDKIEELVDEQ